MAADTDSFRKSTETLVSFTYTVVSRKIRDMIMVGKNSLFAFRKKIYYSNACKLQNFP